MGLVQKVFIFCLLLQLSFTAKFDISSVSTCTQQSDNGYCIKWEQNGTVQQELPACFPGNAKLLVFENGTKTTKQMKDIKVGDLVMGSEGGSETYSEILTWIHRKADTQVPYLSIRTSKGDFVTSQFHNIALKDESYLFGKELLHKQLYGNEINVNSLENVEEIGMYAPLTRSGNYYVLTSQGEKILAHNLANIRRPQYYQGIFRKAIEVWEMMYGKSEEEMHPVADWMKKTFAFAIEE